MAKKTHAPKPPAGEVEPHQKFSFKRLLSTRRQIFYFAFFLLWCAVDIALLGLVSQQIHNHGRMMSDWPTGKYQHAMGLLLFASIFALLIGIFHAWLNLPILLFLFIANAAFFGTGAGIIYETPFGHGFQCGNPIELIPQNWRSDLKYCRRVTGIEGLAWSMFGLALIGWFFAFQDKWSLVSKRSAVYDDPEAQAVNEKTAAL